MLRWRATAQPGKLDKEGSGTEVTGIVTAAGPQTQKITIEDQTYVMP
jgi:hypothetical protein